MLRMNWVISLACLACIPAHAQMTPGQAAAEGRTSGQAAIGPTSAGITEANGLANVPGYNTTAVEGSYFGGGNGNLTSPTATRISDCAASTTPDCAAINFMLNKTSAVNPISINSSDPLVQQNRDIAQDPGSVLGGMMASFPPRPTSSCAAAATGTASPSDVIEVCASYAVPTVNTCQKDWILETSSWWTYRCQKTGTLNLLCETSTTASCAMEGKPLASFSGNRAGAFNTATITPTGTAGLYQYAMRVPYSCGSEGSASVNFSLDTIGEGGYVSINVTGLDDTAAVAVNNTTMIAGHPNSGPIYSAGTFPTNRQDFQIGYTWSEDIGGMQCVQTDWEGSCIRMGYVPNIQTMYANTKLLDYCPGGYAPSSQKQFQYCDPDTGSCTPISTYTPQNVQGFFCNSEGKFLLNRQEGNGTWGGSVSGSIPIRQGANTISAYWGTGPYGRACGNVTVSGMIFNVGPVCRTSDQVVCK